MPCGRGLRKLAKGEDKDWAWDLVGMTPQERKTAIKEKVEKWYSTEDADKIKNAYKRLVGVA